MSKAIENLEPKALWKHFAAISAIPRASGKEAAAREYVLAQARALNLEAIQDAVGNVVVRKPARPGRENAIPAALQGHLDMVCEKNEGTAHNFDVDPIEFTRDGDWLRAKGTTLGADNGVGVAAGLAVMESDSIAHGPLEFVFTIDEETGLTGASEFPVGLLHAKYFLNLDGEEQNTLCIGCAGGVNTVARRTVALLAPSGGAGFRVKVAGLSGGHSGIDIHRGRGNALRILGRALQALATKLPLEISSVNGGSKRNAIPREAFAIVALNAGQEAALKEILAVVEAAERAELGAFDPGLRITAEPVDAPAQVFSAADADAVVSVLAAQHHGVIAMSPDVPGLVQTSTNHAIVATNGAEVMFEGSQRSPIESSKLAAARMVATVFEQSGFAASHGGGYPGWKPEPTGEITLAAQKAHEEILGVKPELVAMHAGLECGVIGEKHAGMQMISFGPHMEAVHSPDERLLIPSVEPFWRLLTGLLERL